MKFLSQPGLDFGATVNDIEVLEAPSLLRQRAAELLGAAGGLTMGAERIAHLRRQFDAADWQVLAQEFRARVHSAASFFDGDAKTHQSAA